MRLHQLIAICFVSLSILAVTASAQDFPSDLIDDLPKERKEASRKDQPKRGKKPATQAEGFDPYADPPPADILPKIPGKWPSDDAVIRQGFISQDRTTLIDDVNTVGRGEPNAAAKTANVIPDNLGEALARALGNSPTVLVAEAKVRQAQAELNEVRLSVTHDMTLAFQRRARNKQIDDMRKKNGVSGVGTSEFGEKLHQVILEDESRIIYLLGVGSNGAHRPDPPQASIQRTNDLPSAIADHLVVERAAVVDGRAASPERGSLSKLPDKMRTTLETRVEFAFERQPLSDVLEYLTECLKDPPGGPVQFISQYDLSETFVTLYLKDITVAAGLQALADLHKYGFIFRDYGILVVETDDEIDSYRAAGTPMIAPTAGDEKSAGSRDTGAPGSMMGGMPGMSSMSGHPPAASKKARAKK
jgi:hypothetical protein